MVPLFENAAFVRSAVSQNSSDVPVATENEHPVPRLVKPGIASTVPVPATAIVVSLGMVEAGVPNPADLPEADVNVRFFAPAVA